MAYTITLDDKVITGTRKMVIATLDVTSYTASGIVLSLAGFGLRRITFLNAVTTEYPLYKAVYDGAGKLLIYDGAGAELAPAADGGIVTVQVFGV